MNTFFYRPLLLFKKTLFLCFFPGQVILIAQDHVQAPDCPKIPKADTLFDRVLIDNYSWLRDLDNPQVTEYIEAENAYTEKLMASTEKFQEQLYQEIVGRIKETDESVPYLWNGYWYYTRTEQGKNYTFYCRKKELTTEEEEILLDENQLVEENGYYGVYGHEISPNNVLMAYYVDKTGNFETDVYVRDLNTGKQLADSLNSVTSLVWANDNKTLFYVVQDSVTNRPYKLFRHILGQPMNEDELIFHEKDSLYNLTITKSKSEEYLFLASKSAEQSEIWYLNADSTRDVFQVIHPREKGHLYDVYHYDDKFYILSDKDAINFRLMEAPVGSPSFVNWKEVIPHRNDVMIEEIEIFKDYLVLTENHNSTYNIRIINWKTREEHYIPFEEEAYYVYLGINLDFNTNELRYAYESMKTPNSLLEYNMDTRKEKILKQKEILGGYDPSQYETKKIWCTAEDGAPIPLSIVYKKGLVKDGKNPAMIEGYGAYGYNSLPYFSTFRLSYLDRGFVYAIAHVRGGSERGRQWYEDGKLLKKKNTFADFVACTECLIREGYTSEKRIVATGGSAGGLLMGAVLNMRPELYKGITLLVPFVDVINTMTDPTLPLTTQEYEEWGNPNQKEYFDYILSYSPYDNLTAGEKPHLLFLTGLTDEQVGYWEPLKMVAKLRDLKTDNNKLLLKVQLTSGHGGVSGRYNYYREVAFEQAFVLTLFDIWN